MQALRPTFGYNNMHIIWYNLVRVRSIKARFDGACEPAHARIHARDFLPELRDALGGVGVSLHSASAIQLTPAKRGITRDYTPFLLILQGMTLQLQGITLPPF